MDFTDLIEVIELAVILRMECLIANWWGSWVTGAAWGDLVINVQVLGAALFSVSVHRSTSMNCEHLGTIGITFVMAISQVVLVMMVTEFMASNPCCLAIVLYTTRISHSWF